MLSVANGKSRRACDAVIDANGNKMRNIPNGWGIFLHRTDLPQDPVARLSSIDRKALRFASTVAAGPVNLKYQ